MSRASSAQVIVLCVVTPPCLWCIGASVGGNCNWGALIFLVFYSQAWWILIQTVLRAALLITAYGGTSESSDIGEEEVYDWGQVTGRECECRCG